MKFITSQAEMTQENIYTKYLFKHFLFHLEIKSIQVYIKSIQP